MQSIHDLINADIITDNDLKYACLRYNFSRIIEICDFHNVFFTEEDAQEVMEDLGYI